MSKASNYLENAMLDLAFRNQAIASPATVYVALYSNDPTDADTGTEITGGAYARQAITFAAPATKVTQNTALIDFPLASANYPAPVTHFGIRDALTGGNLLAYGPFTEAYKSFTADAATDAFTATAHGYANGDVVYIQSTSASVLPAGANALTKYFIIASTTNTFQVSLTSGGALVDITANGAGQIARAKVKTINSANKFSIKSGQLAMTMQAFTTYLTHALINHFFRATVYVRPATIHSSLHTADPGDTGASEFTGGGYARQSITFGASTNGVITNSADITFVNSPALTTTHGGIWDASTAGNLMVGVQHGTAQTPDAGDDVQILTGQFSLTLE